MANASAELDSKGLTIHVYLGCLGFVTMGSIGMDRLVFVIQGLLRILIMYVY